ncbi:MAG: ECF transporter S component [Firmicutes bacterium]|jgi:hypothetical protein|nr:ECF transporter S component [Bacillota bacterium]
MQKKIVKEIVISGLFIAIGLILPMLFHIFNAGAMFLPMHIPVLVAACIVSLPFAIAVGVITPILSSLLTGMPPMFPVLPFMIFELMTYGATMNLLYRKFRLNIYPSLILSMTFGRIVSSLVVWVLVSFFMAKLPNPFTFVGIGIIQGLPGIVIQIILIPRIVSVLERGIFTKRVGNVYD